MTLTRNNGLIGLKERAACDTHQENTKDCLDNKEKTEIKSSLK